MARDRIHLVRTLFLPSAGAPARDGNWQPLADVYRTPDGWLVKWDLAGVRPEDISLVVEGPRLTVRGTRRDACLSEGCRHYRLEIAYSQFERTIELPEDVERACIATEYRQGMLLVRLQKEAPR
jgi:HSP20 family protein